jgi:hypothetical protein
MSLVRIITNLATMASTFVWGERKGRRPTDLSAYEYAKAKNDWLIEHTDSLLGRPYDSDGVHYFESARRNWDAKNVPNEYRPAFRELPAGKVMVYTDEFPLEDQKYIYEWMVERMEEIGAAITKCLLTLPGNCGVSKEQASTVFQPNRIIQIEFRGSDPVQWTIVFDTDIGEGEALVGKARGNDQQVENADLDYG